MAKFKLQDGINKCTNEEYHSDRSRLSSSSYKLLLKDTEKFEKEFIKGIKTPVAQQTQNNFDEGTYAHSLILEPETIPDEFAFFPEWRKVGQAWRDFKVEHAGKILLSKPQKVRVEKWVEACKERQKVIDLIKGGFPEQTIAGDFMGIPSKVRADYVNVDEGYIVDVKTTGYGTDVDTFKYTVDSFSYDLSAALYCDLFSQYYGKPFDFYFYVLGKKDQSCEVYKLSAESMEKGRLELMKAAELYKKCLSSGDWTKPSGYVKIDIESEYEILEV